MRWRIFIGPTLLILGWELIEHSALVNQFLVPAPLRIVEVLWAFLGSGTILPDLLATLGRTALSFVIALVVGVPIGLVLGSSRGIYRSAEFVIDFFRSIPATALFPLFLILSGVGDWSKIGVASFTSVFVIIFNTAYGVLHARKARVMAVHVMGATRLQVFRLVLFWESLPQLFIGARTAASWSLVIIVVTEMFVGTTVGLGKQIIDAQIVFDIPAMYAVILLTGIVGYLVNLIFIITERKVLHWSGK